MIATSAMKAQQLVVLAWSAAPKIISLTWGTCDSEWFAHVFEDGAFALCGHNERCHYDPAKVVMTVQLTVKARTLATRLGGNRIEAEPAECLASTELLVRALLTSVARYDDETVVIGDAIFFARTPEKGLATALDTLLADNIPCTKCRGLGERVIASHDIGGNCFNDEWGSCGTCKGTGLVPASLPATCSADAEHEERATRASFVKSTVICSYCFSETDDRKLTASALGGLMCVDRSACRTKGHERIQRGEYAGPHFIPTTRGL